MSKKDGNKKAKAIVEKYVREALEIRAGKKVSQSKVKKVTQEVLETTERGRKAA